MVVNRTGTRGQPIIDNPMRGRADLQAVSDFAASRGLLRAGTSTDRAALEPGELFDGLHWYETDTRTTYVYSADANGWINAAAARSTANSGIFTPSDGWASGPQSTQYLRVMNDTNWVYASFIRTGPAITVNSTGNVANVTVGRLTIPSTWQTGFSSGLSGRLAAFVVDTAGLVQLAAVAPGATIATNEALSFTGPYPYL